VINGLENIRAAIALLEQSTAAKHGPARDILALGDAETEDAIDALAGGGLHPEAVGHLRQARRLIDKAGRSFFFRTRLTREAIEEQQRARGQLVAAP
jgi:hypothetical protein